MNSVAESLFYPQIRFRHSRPDLRLVLALALALHAALLLIPLRQPAPVDLPRPVTVDVRFEPTPFREAEPVTEPTPAEPLPVPEIPVEAVPQTTPAEAVRPEEPSDRPEQPVAQPLRPPLTTAYLLETARDMDWQLEVPMPLIPGVPVIPDLPLNLTRPIMPLSPNAFDGVVLPTEVVVLDQWIDPTGVMNAVVKTPNGEILCGSAKPWDPMDPLVEHVAMYRKCGGGGKRKNSASSPFLTRD